MFRVHISCLYIDAKTIAKELDFNLTCVHPKDTKSSRGPIRMASKSWAITALTIVSSEWDHFFRRTHLFVLLLFRRDGDGRN